MNGQIIFSQRTSKERGKDPNRKKFVAMIQTITYEGGRKTKQLVGPFYATEEDGPKELAVQFAGANYGNFSDFEELLKLWQVPLDYQRKVKHPTVKIQQQYDELQKAVRANSKVKTSEVFPAWFSEAA